MKTSECDVAIVGSGLAGATIAFFLTRAGHTVTVLEKGPAYPYPHIEQFTAQGFSASLSDYFLPRDLKHHTLSGQYQHKLENERFMNTGGSASRWSAIALRMRPQDFKTRSLFGFDLDWPLTYDELEPAYCRAEALLGVSGTDDDNPFAPARSRPYPLPPFELGWDDLRFQEKLAAGGIHMHTTAQARTRLDYDERPGCKNYGRCFNCPIGARYSPNVYLERALATGLCTLHNDVSVRRIHVEGLRARTLVCRQHAADDDRELAARYVVVAAGAIESARLLLLSASASHPDGLGNDSGHVGSNFALHHLWGGNIRFQEPIYGGRFGGWTGQSHQFLDPPERGRHGGAKIELSSRPPSFASVARQRWTSVEDLRRRLRSKMYTRRVALHCETALSPEKSITLSREADRFGDPFAHVHYVGSPFDRETYAFARRIFERIVAASGGEEQSFAPFESYHSAAHHMGTCRMGERAADSVVDRHGRVHGIANLYVIGESNFTGSSGAVNPALTVAALAIRTSDHLLDQLP